MAILRVAIVAVVVSAFGQAAGHAAPPTPAELAVHQYFYVDFPRRVQALDDQIALAEAELAVLRRRVDSYRPMRSFGRYSATWTADEAARLAVIAAERRVACLRDEQAALWRERQAVAIALIAGGG